MSGAIAPSVAHDLAARGGILLLDVRPAAEFVRGHAPRALSVPYSPRGLAERVGTFAPDAAVIIVAGDDAIAQAAARQLGDAGISVRGSVDGGFVGWAAAGLPQSTIGEVAIDELATLSRTTTVVDVREPAEWVTGHVPGALLISLGTLRGALPAVPRDQPIVTICEAGVRSSTAASILEAAGFTAVAHVPAGSSGYRRSGLRLEFPTAEEVDVS